VNDWLAATPSGTETLPRDVAERVERVFEFHRQTKYSYQSMRANPIVLDWKKQPSAYRTFPDLPKVALPTSLVDAPVAMVPLLAEGLAAVPESLLQPPQNLRTLATWLYLAYGMSVERTGPAGKMWLRTCPSSGALYPCEIYVAAFGIEGLEPGLYHYSIREFALRKMREGIDTLNQIKRGRPDLNFLNSVPAALLISTIYARSAWRYRQRGYRCALLDAGHLVQNMVGVANGLGIQTMPRLLINDNTMRDLIGVAADSDFGAAESVQAMVVWADTAIHPITAPAGARPPAPGSMRPIVRAPLSSASVPYGSILATHLDCVAPGMPVREIRPPYTELAPVPEAQLTGKYEVTLQPTAGPTVRQVALSRRSTRQFSRGAISRDQFLLLNRLSFRGGSVLPLFPDGPHAALVRPFWIVNGVVGMEPGVWYYHPPADRWAALRHGEFRTDAAYLSTEQPMCGEASAVCFLMANLQTLMHGAGPDAYRLAHLEAGLMGQRVYAAATALGVACCGISTFYDDDVRNFFGLEKTGWEPVYELVVGLATQ
jgi:SagB-type dehydrogenase family enzyme